MISTLPQATFGPVVVLLAAALYQRNLDGKHKLWNILLIERCSATSNYGLLTLRNLLNSPTDFSGIRVVKPLVCRFVFAPLFMSFFFWFVFRIKAT
jgi:hypothetical protein